MIDTHQQFLDRWRAARAAFNGTDDPPHDDATFDFAGAVVALRMGLHVARDTWPAGQFVFRQAGYLDGIPLNANTAAATGIPQGTMCVFDPYLMLCSNAADAARPRFEHWAPTGRDCLADDWRVVPAG